MPNNGGSGKRRKSVYPPKPAEDDGINIKTGRPAWDEFAPDAKDPGRSTRKGGLLRYTGPKPMSATDRYVTQRKGIT